MMNMSWIVFWRHDVRVDKSAALIGHIALFFSVVMLVGCYQHVIRTEGPSARRVDEYEPNYDPDKRGPLQQIDDALFGRPEPQSPRKRIDRTP